MCNLDNSASLQLENAPASETPLTPATAKAAHDTDRGIVLGVNIGIPVGLLLVAAAALRKR